MFVHFFSWSCFRIKEVAERWNRYGTGAGSSALSSLRGVRAVAAGPAHIACLLDDGTICRAAFSIIPDRLDLSKADASKNGGNGGGGSGGGGTSGGKQGGSGGGCGSRQQPRTRARIMRNSIRAAPSSQGMTECLFYYTQNVLAVAAPVTLGLDL